MTPSITFQPAFESFQAFYTMSPHGLYVWSAWGIALVCLLWLILNSINSRKRILRRIKQQHIQRNKTR